MVFALFKGFIYKPSNGCTTLKKTHLNGCFLLWKKMDDCLKVPCLGFLGGAVMRDVGTMTEMG